MSFSFVFTQIAQMNLVMPLCHRIHLCALPVHKYPLHILEAMQAISQDLAAYVEQGFSVSNTSCETDSGCTCIFSAKEQTYWD